MFGASVDVVCAGRERLLVGSTKYSVCEVWEVTAVNAKIRRNAFVLRLSRLSGVITVVFADMSVNTIRRGSHPKAEVTQKGGV